MSDTEPPPPPTPSDRDELLLELAKVRDDVDMTRATLENRLDLVDAKLEQLAQANADRRAPVVAMLTAALSVLRETSNGDSD